MSMVNKILWDSVGPKVTGWIEWVGGSMFHTIDIFAIGCASTDSP